MILLGSVPSGGVVGIWFLYCIPRWQLVSRKTPCSSLGIIALESWLLQKFLNTY